MHDPKRIKVALLQGGNSSERDISIQSGKGALDALLAAGYSIDCLDPAEEADLLRLLTEKYDVAFICLHGEGGEDGCIQGFLETINLPYTCSDVISSALCMDKAITKRFYKEAGIPTPASIEVSRPQDIDDESISRLVSEIQQELGTKCVIKVVNGGSSLGVYIAQGAIDIKEALLSAFEEAELVLVEQYIAGREVTNVVLDRVAQKSSSSEKSIFKTQALPIIEIIPANDSYDYDSKYLPGGSKHICPAQLAPETTAEIQEWSVRAHKALGCSGVSRTDFIIDDEGQAWALETNTVPGMTKTSLLPDAALVEGVSFPDLCTGLIEEALVRAGR